MICADTFARHSKALLNLDRLLGGERTPEPGRRLLRARVLEAAAAFPGRVPAPSDALALAERLLDIVMAFRARALAGVGMAGP